MASRNEVSAGGVVYRRGEMEVEVLICRPVGKHYWVLPKGLVEKGESPEVTAVREAREETGAQTRLIAPLGESEKYVYTAHGMRVFKTVHYFLLEYQSGDVADHDREMAEVKWASLPEALDAMGFEGGRVILRRAQAMLETMSGADATPPETM
ncbi:MAG: NUDIX domain-containing protein [bacterium]|nr:NUDIX domain-containing protein [bacterium]